MKSKEKSTKDNFILDLKLRFIKVLDIVVITAAFALVWFLYYSVKISSPFYFKGDLAIVFLYGFLYYVFVRVYDAVQVQFNRISELIYSQVLASLITNFVMYIFICLLSKRIVNIIPGFGMFSLQFGSIVVWCYLAHVWYMKHNTKKRTVIIWDQRKGLKNLIQEYGLDIKYDVVRSIKSSTIVEIIENNKGEVVKELEDIKYIFLTGVHSHERNVIIKYCVEHNIKAFLIPRIGDLMISGSRKIHMFHLPMLVLQRYNPVPEYLFAKRFLDIFLSLIAIIIFSPFMIITAIAVKLDGGPVFYKQQRLTKNGKVFNVLKFRSMRVDAEKDGKAVLSSGANDDRVTKVGKVIRAIRFDELPQLFNILKGDMTIVGPRPERPEIHKKYCKTLPEFNLRLQCKAGLTGYAQVYGKYNTTPYDKLLMDLMYISAPSIFQDLQIMFATVKILFMKESTEGFKDGVTRTFEE